MNANQVYTHRRLIELGELGGNGFMFQWNSLFDGGFFGTANLEQASVDFGSDPAVRLPKGSQLIWNLQGLES